MNNSFLSYLLCLSLSLVLILYLNQIMTKNKKNMTLDKNKHNMHNMQKLPMKHILQPKQMNKCKYEMPIHRIGPIINFHQNFNKYSTNPTYTTVKGCGVPTGIRELGWRNMYISNYSKNEVPEDVQFDGIITRNFLDNMESVDNIYRKCN